MNQNRWFREIAKSLAMASMLFVGVFGGALPVEAAGQRVTQLSRDLKQGGAAAEGAVRSLAGLRDPRLMPIYPLMRYLTGLRDRYELADAGRINNTTIGETVVSGFTGVTPFESSKNGVRSFGQLTITGSPYRGKLVTSTVVRRGELEWNFDQELSLVSGDLSRFTGSLVKLDVSRPETPEVLAVALGDWLISEDAATDWLTADNLAAAPDSNTAAAAVDGDDLANDALDGFADCPAATVATSTSCALGIAILIIVVIIVVVFCYIFGWYFCQGPIYNLLDKFDDLKLKLQRALEGGGEPWYA